MRKGSLNPETVRVIRVYFIRKPSKYDDDGYVSVFGYGVQPNNTLNVLSALNDEFNRHFSGKTTQRPPGNHHLGRADLRRRHQLLRPFQQLKKKAHEDGVELLIGLAGVQSNQYPRGRDLALQFVAEGMTTMMGGFHVSGYPESCKFLNSVGVTTIVGEAENLWGFIVEDFLAGTLKPQYSVTEGIRAKTGQDDIIVPIITDRAQLPVLDDRYLTRFFNTTMTPLDTSRGCPFTCSYCSVKNVMGRTDALAPEPQRGRRMGARCDALFTASSRCSWWMTISSARHDGRKSWTGLIEVKKEFPKLSFMMQVDVDASCYANVAEGETETAKHRRSRRFTELAAAAGCYQAFVGIESLNPDNLNFATKYQNTDDRQHKMKIEEARARVIGKYQRVVDNWHKVGVSVHAGYMLGFPFDGPDCGRVAAQTLRKIGFDIVSYFIMTPLPGTEDQVRYAKEGDIIDWDFNQLDSQHVTLKHPRLDTRQWMQAYNDAFRGFYSIGAAIREILTAAGGRGPQRRIAPLDVAPVLLLLLQLSAGTPSDGRRNLADSPARRASNGHLGRRGVAVLPRRATLRCDPAR